MPRISPLLVPAVALTAIALAACGDSSDMAVTEPSDDGQLYTATATVLETPQAPPTLCLGAMTSSLPPTGCGGAEIANWRWDEVDDAESISGTTWGSYTVVGTYDGERFTLTEPPVPPANHDVDAGEQPTFPTPCEEPAGGWAVVDESTATDESMYAAIAYAEAQPDHAGTWLDQSIHPGAADNDPTRLVLNFRFTGDADRHEREVREIWGGALCISLAERSDSELRVIQNELHGELPGVLMSSVDVVTGMVDIQLVFDDGSLQRVVDDRYGAGIVRISARLQPVT